MGMHKNREETVKTRFTLYKWIVARIFWSKRVCNSKTCYIHSKYHKEKPYLLCQISKRFEHKSLGIQLRTTFQINFVKAALSPGKKC